jgi:lipoteichoic acid synthase
VLVLAKLAVLLLRAIDGGAPPSAAAWPALVHHDAIVAAAFGAVDAALARLARRRRWAEITAWTAYALIAVYVALNVPVARLFATPLTYSMLGATGGALSDSIADHVTLSNLAAMLLVLVAALLLPRPFRRTPGPRAIAAIGASLAIVALAGSLAARRADTLGLHRNALSALVLTGVARLSSPAATAAVGALAAEGEATDLSHLSGAARGRNVVWIILESTAAEYLALYGGTPDPTPRLGELARDAIVLDRAYAACPESIKGLLSMLCSLHPAAYTEAGDYVHQRIPCRSIAHVLADAGYRTGFFHSGRFRYLGMRGIVDGRGFDELHDAETIGGEHASSFGTDDASTVRRLLAFVDDQKGGQFFAVYSPIAGHHPYRSPGTGPRPFAERTERDRYLNDLYAGDAALGELVDGLARRGLADSTLFVVVGDHGEAFEQHPGNIAHTLHLYEENVRVPMIFAAPGLFTRQLRPKQVASVLDIAPTTLALLGLAAPAEYEGRVLLEPAPGLARFHTDHSVLKLGLRQGRYKLLLDTEHGRARLFDLDSDPHEQRDLGPEDPERVARYRQHLLDWSEAQRVRVRDFRLRHAR